MFSHSQFYRVFWVSVAAGLVAGRIADRTRRLADPSGDASKKT